MVQKEKEGAWREKLNSESNNVQGALAVTQVDDSFPNLQIGEMRAQRECDIQPPVYAEVGFEKHSRYY